MKAKSPTKPLLTARFAILNTSAYKQSRIVDAFKGELEKLGYRINQTPSIRSYTAKYRLTKEGPFPDDDAKSVYETMYVMGPAGKEKAIAKDITNDPKGSRPILEQRKPVVTAVTWNITAPQNQTPQQLKDALWNIEKAAFYNKEKYTGTGWDVVVDTWGNAPVKLAPYPDKPGIPQALFPPEPKPVPKPPKPTPKPVPPPPPPEPVPVVPPPSPIYVPPAASAFNWKLWAGILGLGGLAYWMSSKK